MKDKKKSLSKKFKDIKKRNATSLNLPSVGSGKKKTEPPTSRISLRKTAVDPNKGPTDHKKTTIATQLSRVAQEKKDQLQSYKQDLDRANRIQFNLLPDKIPKIPGMDMRVHYQSSKEVGGDYYDFITVDPEHLGIVVADVSGKGVPAAMVMAMTRSFLRLLARRRTSPRETVIRLNKFLARDIRGIMFVTLIYMILNIRTRELQICNAGHNPLLLKTESSLQIINPPGMAVGLDLGNMFNNTLQEETITLEKGDRVLVYTDGVSESMNEKQDEFGEEPLVEILQSNYKENSQKFLNLLIQAIQQHQGQAEQHDDITIVTFSYIN